MAARFRRLRRHVPAVFLLILFGCLYLISSVDRTFWRENEAFYSLGARSVLRGQVLVPLINHDFPADKPPLMFWWVALVSSLYGGVTEWSARLANVLATMGVLIALYVLAQRRVGRWAAVLSCVILSTSYEFWESATGVSTDMVLLLFLTAAWGAMQSLLTKGFRRSRWWMLWGGVALAALTKGPVAFVLTALIAGVYCLWQFGWRGAFAALLRLKPFTGMVLAVAPFGGWVLAVLLLHGAAPLRLVLLKHNVQRFVDAFDHEKPWYYFFGELPVNLLPWSLLLPFVAWDLLRRRWGLCRKPSDADSVDERGGGGRLGSLCSFALAAIVTVFVFFSFSTSKRDYYILPVMPWCALLTGIWLWRKLADLAPCRVEQECSLRDFGRVLMGSRPGRVVFRAVLVVILGMVAYAAIAGRWLEPGKSPKPFALAVSRSVDADDRLVIVDEEDPRVWFYLEEKFDLADDDAAGMESICRLLESRQEIDLLVQADDLSAFFRFVNTPLFVQEVLHYEGKPVYLLTSEASQGLSPLLGIGVEDLSGIAFSAGRQTIFAVGDEGEIVESNLLGKTLDRRNSERDLRAVEVSGTRDRLFVFAVNPPRIIVVSADGLNLLEEYRLTTSPEAGTVAPGESPLITGICRVPSGGDDRLFAVTHDRPPLLIEVEISSANRSPAAMVTETWPVSAEEIADLTWDAAGHRILGLESERNLILSIDETGRILERWRLPEADYAAIASIPDGGLLVCEENGLLWRCSLRASGEARLLQPSLVP